jgi:hypothetical protein
VPIAERRRPSVVVVAVAALVLLLGAVGFLVSAGGVASQLLPRRFTGAQQAAIMNWEVAGRWRDLPAGTIFAGSIGYPQPAVLDGTGNSLSLSAHRVGIAEQAPCRSAVDPAAAAALVREGCEAVLRATYVDGTDSYVVTVGVAAFAGGAQAVAAERQIDAVKPRAGALAPGVLPVAFAGTPAAYFTAGSRQITEASADGSYLVMYAIGYADGRPRVPITADSYADAEMTGMGTGVAGAIASVLGESPAPPHCPGTPGC